MKCMRTSFGVIIVVALMVTGLLGCPPNVGLQLLVSSETLDFGVDREEIRLRVFKGYSGTRMEPLVATADQDWILPQNCLTAADQCTSRGPSDAIRIPVRIDRNKLALGVNEGRIRLKSGAASEVVVTVLADEIMQADFVAQERAIGLGQPLELLDASLTTERSGEIDRWLWEFGDGAISTRKNPSHVYSEPGSYDITLTVTTSRNISRTITKPAFVQVRHPANVVNFTASSTNVDVNEEITFRDLSTVEDAPIIARSWNFGDGNGSTALAPRHRYANPGVYTVSLTITTNGGDMRAVKENYIIVRSAGSLRANFTYDASGGATAYATEVVQFFDLSEVGRGEITAWAWDFGDGATSVEQNPTHRYDTIGTFTVTLLVRSAYGTDSKEKSLTVVYRPPAADFDAMPREQWTDTPIMFFDQSVPGFGEIASWEWDFGNGGVSTDQNPTYSYASSGTYTVTLTVTADDTENSFATISKRDFITIRDLPDPPDPAFNFSPRLALVDERVSFDASNTRLTEEPALAYIWDFGDDSPPRTGRTTSHVFQEPGRYTVTLTVVTESTSLNEPPGVSVSRTVVVDRAPSPEFTASPNVGYTFIETFAFTNVEQLPDVRPIRQYNWNFGDDNTSNFAAPTHVYEAEGQYRVNLTVTFRHTASRASDVNLEKTAVRTVTVKPSIYDYIDRDDGCYFYSSPITEAIYHEGQHVATARIIQRLTSQCWNPDNAVSGASQRWVHPVTIITPEPTFRKSDTAMLFIDGGSRASAPSTDFAQIAMLTGTTVVHLRNVPSQPILFRDEVIQAGEEDTLRQLVLRERTEDEIIAYSYDQYLKSYEQTGGNPNYEWPLLFPMAKAAVKAMDMTEEVLGLLSPRVDLDGFVVAGASKRGWTTWLTGAIDPRVKAIAPMVINVLNMQPHLEHHRAVYGYWSPAIYDYAQERVFERLVSEGGTIEVSPGARTLLDYVDPYQYALRGRYPMPKYLLNATGDEFFVPDTAELYFHDLEPQKHISYIPNVGHSMGLGSLASLTPEELTNPFNVTGMLISWYMAITQDQNLPEFTYTFEENGAIRADVDSDRLPVNAYLWKATSEGKRDFRHPSLGDAWERTSLTRRTDEETGNYYYITPMIADPGPGNYTAYFVQLEYANTEVTFPTALVQPLQQAGYRVPNLVFSTGVRVTPEAYPEFTGYLANVERPDAVLFDEAKLPVVVTYGTAWEMGNYYGQLLAPKINGFVRDYVAYYLEEIGATTAQLRTLWNAVAPFLDQRLHDEMQGIVAARDVTITLEQLRLAHAAALFEALGTWTSTSTMAYREMLQGGDAAHAVTLNRRFHRYQCAVMYIPDEGVPHTVMTYAGLTFGRTGVNAGGISAVEVIDLPFIDEDGNELIDPYTGEPFAFTGLEPNALPLIRTILYDALSLRDAVGMVKEAPLQRPTTMMLGDGRNEKRGAMLRLFPGNLAQGQPPVVLEERYDMAFTDFGIEDRRGLVYRTTTILQPQLQGALESLMTPQISIPELLGMASLPPFAQPGTNVLNVVFDNQLLNIFVAVARGNIGSYQDAFEDTFDAFNMQLLLP